MKTIEITKYYSAHLDLDEFMDKGDFRGEWEEWKSWDEDGYTDEDIDEFIIEKMYEYGPPEDMYGVHNVRMDNFEVSIW